MGRIKKIASKQLYVSLVPMPGIVTFKTPAMALKTVTSKDGLGVYASSDILFKGALFGRDSLEVAEDLLSIRPRLVEKIILTLASLQGEKVNSSNEEMPGKIVHEYRRRRVDGKNIDPVSLSIFEQLSKHWGGDREQLVYFGSIDSTPHFIRVTGLYVSKYGPKILSKKVKLLSGKQITLKKALSYSVDWLTKQLQVSKSGLLEYKKVNPHGIDNQVWKDSVEFYVHRNGQLVNHKKPIASIEVQALVYDALIYADKIFKSNEEGHLAAVKEFREKVLNLLWMGNVQYFALGLDYSNSGKTRHIKTITANPAALLDSFIFEDLDESQKHKYIHSIVSMIMSNEFLTDAGIRSRALSEAHLISFWDYHGSYTSWPKETYDIAKGLRRHGFEKLAQQLENRLLNVVKLLRSYSEYIYVDSRGRVLGAASTPHSHANL